MELADGLSPLPADENRLAPVRIQVLVSLQKAYIEPLMVLRNDPLVVTSNEVETITLG